MAIEVQCPECGRTYAVHDELAGKTAQCRNCGAFFPVWSAGMGQSLGPEAASSALEELGRSADRQQASSPGVSPYLPRIQRHHRSAGDSFSFPLAPLLDAYLAISLLIICYGLAVLIAIPAAAHDPSPGRSLLLLVLHALALVYGMAPAGMLAVWLIGRLLRFELPPRAFIKMIAVLAVPTALSYTIPVALDLPIGLHLGHLVGLLPALLVLWFLYRLRLGEAILSLLAALVAAWLVRLAVWYLIDLVFRTAGGQV